MYKRQTLHILHAKSILLRAYFELFLFDNSYFDLLSAQTIAFEKFVRRNAHISEPTKEVYLNFILFSRKIANAIFENSSNPNLYQTINNTKSLALKSWLLEKCNRLI